MANGPIPTITTPSVLKGGTLEGPDVVTALNLYKTDKHYPLPRGTQPVVIGSDPSCGIPIRSNFVSSRHCQLVRRWGGLRVTDQDSKNGLWFQGARERSFELRPGQVFNVGAFEHRFLALNDEMSAAFPELVDILGAEEEHALRSDTPSPSDLVVAAVNVGHVLVTSERDCQQERLARIVHAISMYRKRPILEPDLNGPVSTLADIAKRSAVRSTLVLNLGERTDRLPKTFLSSVFAPPHQIRVIVLAASVDVAVDALGVDNVTMMQRVWLRPLGMRPEAIPRLLDRMFEERGSTLRFAHMTPENQAALRANNWEGNFTSLRHAADYLVVIARSASILQAARTLGISSSTFYHWYSKTMGFKGKTLVSPAK